MNIVELIDSNLIFARQHFESRKQMFRFATKKIAEAYISLDADDLFDSLTRREKLGSTYIGNGVAIPHCRLNTNPKINKETICSFMSLDNSIDYKGDKVNLVFVIIALGTNQKLHIEVLSNIAKLADDTANVQQLALAKSVAEVTTVLMKDNANAHP